MKRTYQRTVGFLGAVLMATQLIGASTTQAVRFPGSSSSFEQALPVTAEQKEVDRLIKQMSSNAAIAAGRAEALDSLTRTGQRAGQHSHGTELNQAKEVINAMGADFKKLQELRGSALPWQQSLIDRMGPMLTGLAGYTTEAIERLNEDRGRLISQEYRDAIGNMNAYAGQTRTLVSVNLNYAQAREKLNRLDASPVEPVAKASPERATVVSSKAVVSLEQRLRSELLKLPYYGVFDHLEFAVDGDQVTLSGQVSRPVLKQDAEQAARRVEGVTVVTSNIEVLPLSPNDDRLRMATYRAIYGHSTLARYALNPQPVIRIIVENGNVTLKGMVGSAMDRNIAFLQANGVAGTFSVTNNLQVGS